MWKEYVAQANGISLMTIIGAVSTSMFRKAKDWIR